MNANGIGNAYRNIMSSPQKLAIAGGVIGVGLAQFSALTHDGKSAMPTVEGSIKGIALTTAKMAVINGALNGMLHGQQAGGFMNAAKPGAINGAILGASMAAGSVVGTAVASTFGY